MSADIQNIGGPRLPHETTEEDDTKYMALVLRAAQWYVQQGWAVFPLHSIKDGKCTCGVPECVDAGKHPRVQRGLKEASKDAAKIAEWFGEGAPLSNVAIATGLVSGVTVIDVDIGPGKMGADTWGDLTREKGEPNTLMAKTGSGGLHAFFAYNSVLKTKGNALGKGVDVRNDGGYVVVAPSRHRSGGSYAWIDARASVEPLPAHLTVKKETRGRPRKEDYHRSKYSIEQVRRMLEAIPSDDRDDWRNFGVILGREFNRSDDAWQLYIDWSEKGGGKKGRNHDEIMREAFYELSQQNVENGRTIGTIVRAAMEHGWAPQLGEVPLERFVYFGPGNNFIYRPTISHWQAAAVDAAVSPLNVEGKVVKASDWLKINQLATSMTSEPNLEDDYVKGFDARDGRLIEVEGAALFNTYRRPTIELGEARFAGKFVEHVRRCFPKPSPRKNEASDADQFLDYMAHRAQKPGEKPRFALLLAGEQGTGKDTCVEFCVPAIGAWNMANIEPAALESNFNEYEAKTLVRISETANLHELNKWAFNEQTKVLIAGNPDASEINPKYGQKYSIRKYCGVILTTNHLATGIYIPPGDRRYDVLESATAAEMGIPEDDDKRAYFADLWGWFNNGGDRHVAAFLMERDISKFDPNVGQRKTAAHKAVVAAGFRSDEWLDDALEKIGRPQAARADWVINAAVDAGLKANEIRPKFAGAMARAGYAVFHNPEAKDGRWKISKGVNVLIYTVDGKEPKDWDALKHERF